VALQGGHIENSQCARYPAVIGRYQVGQLVFVGSFYTFGGPSKSKSSGLEYPQ
jgi:hypothetical protein